MRTYITVTLLLLLTLSCKKEETNYAQNLQGTWIRAYTYYAYWGPVVYPTSGTIYKVNFNRTTLTMYVNDTLYRRDPFTITKYQDPNSNKEMPYISSPSIMAGPFTITADTLSIYHPNMYDAPNEYYIRYK
jgi:hypothetical protein